MQALVRIEHPFEAAQEALRQSIERTLGLAVDAARPKQLVRQALGRPPGQPADDAAATAALAKRPARRGGALRCVSSVNPDGVGRDAAHGPRAASIGSEAPGRRATRTSPDASEKPPTSSASIRAPTKLDAGKATSTGTTRPCPSSESTRNPRSAPSHKPPLRAPATRMPPVRDRGRSRGPGRAPPRPRPGPDEGRRLRSQRSGTAGSAWPVSNRSIAFSRIPRSASCVSRRSASSRLTNFASAKIGSCAISPPTR
jgi:hypothetical protein